MTLQVGAVIFERYRIVRLLNQGGFGAIYRVWDTSLGRPCALKENLDVSEEARRQFEREAKILAGLSHPNLPRVSDYFFIPNQGQYLVMDFVEGQDLQNMLERQSGPLSEIQILPWMDQVCDALAYLHDQKPPIIHRDIKPANIQITPDGRAILVDFGIAKLYDPNLKTTLGARAVTPGYSPIEQYGQDTTDARSDIYALGATIYTLLTGEELPESVKRVVRDPLISPEQLNPTISIATLAALERALQVDPIKRFQHINDFKYALRGTASQQASGRNLLQRTPTAAGQATLPRAKFPWGWILSIGMLVGLLITLVLVVNTNGPSEQGISATSTTYSIVGLTNSSTQTPTAMVIRATDTMQLASPTPELRYAPLVYEIQSGDTCTLIAQRFEISLNELIGFNHLSNDCEIKVGQRLLIPSEQQILDPTSMARLTVQESPIDGMEMVFIPAGQFWMGANLDDTDASDDEKPGHWIYLDAFWMDRTEVTNAMYALCVEAGDCLPPSERGSKTRLPYYGDPRFGDYPVIYINWQDANTYCRWVGRRLPSEAEWEKAARGVDGRTYPWGYSNPTPRLVNFNLTIGDTTPIGSYPDGASPYGLLDMAGNVQEWVVDWYNAQYYRFAPVDNPIGPDDGEFRVLRGGSWFSSDRAVRSAFRQWNYPENGYDSSGFRCAR